MRKGFDKWKKKLASAAVIKSAVVGLACGVFAVALSLAIGKWKEFDVPVWFLIVLGVGLTILAGDVALLFYLPTDKKVAKRLDQTLGLEEAVQTMVEFSSRDGEIVELQRAVADDKLQREPVKGTLKRFWACITAFAVACFALVGALLIPVKTDVVQGQAETPFEISKWQIMRLTSLIEEVKESKAEQAEKDGVVAELETLLAALQETETEKLMKTRVINAIVAVDGVTDGVNTHVKIAQTLALGVERTKPAFAFASLVNTTDVTYLHDNLTAFEDLFVMDEETDFETVQTSFTEFTTTVVAAVAFMEMPTDDGLYQAVCTFAQDAATLTTTATTYEQLKNGLATITDEFETNAQLPLRQQYLNREISDFAISELKLIFNISDSEVPDLSDAPLGGDTGNGDGKGDEDKEEIDDGGFSDGSTQYGSDDKLYYPDENKYVAYGDVMDEYYQHISSKLMDGELSEEMQLWVYEYFSALRDGIEKE